STVMDKQSPLIWYLGNQCTYSQDFFRFLFQFTKYIEKHTSEVFPMRNWCSQIFGPKICNT
ncbi:hypothetical protein K443DRAFT_100133, partial [Laccaria amethystina LaAM-08-1]